MTLTETEKQIHIGTDGVRCPKCLKDDEVDWDSLDFPDDITQDGHCSRCDFSWRDYYTLTSVEVINA